MIFQWQLFLLLIVVAIATPLAGQRIVFNAYGSTEYRYGWVPVLIIAIPMIYFAGTRTETLLNFGDTTAYLSGFNYATTSLTTLINSFTEDSKDIGFSIFTTVIKSVIGNRECVYFTLIAAICIISVLYTYKRFSCNFIVSVFLFLASSDYLQWTYNGIRQFIPVAILFACAGLIIKKKYVPIIFLILLLSTIHATAILMLPMIFIVQGKAWNKKTLLFAVAIIFAIAFVDQFTDLITNIMQNTQYSNEVDQYLSTEGTSIQRILVYSMPTVLAMLFKKRIDAANDPVINLAANMSLIAAFSYILSGFTSGLFLGRIPIYFSLYNYILIPWIIEKTFTKNSVKIIYIALIILYMLFYYYQVHITWGL